MRLPFLQVHHYTYAIDEYPAKAHYNLINKRSLAMRFRLVKNDQRGVAMAMELVLVAVVLVAAGLVGYRAYQQSHVVVPVATSPVAAKPKADIDEAVQAATSSASAESNVSQQADSDASAVTATSAAATNVEGSIDESQF